MLNLDGRTFVNTHLLHHAVEEVLLLSRWFCGQNQPTSPRPPRRRSDFAPGRLSDHGAHPMRAAVVKQGDSSRINRDAV